MKKPQVFADNIEAKTIATTEVFKCAGQAGSSCSSCYFVCFTRFKLEKQSSCPFVKGLQTGTKRKLEMVR